MQKIATQSNQALQWRQPHMLKMEYELHAGEELVATLRFRSFSGTLATAQSADGCWTFKRVGFFQTHVTVRACDSETDLAIFKNNTWKGGGTLILPDGREYLVTTNFWGTEYGFKTAAGEPVVNFKTKGLLHQSTEFEILPAGANLTELPWMILLGWYLALMMSNDATTAAVVTTVAIS